MLTDREAFKVGFLKACADKGLDMAETHEVVKEALAAVKEADLQAILTKPYEATIDVAANAGKTIGNAGLWAGMVGPAVLGGLAGAGAASATDIDDTDVKVIKKQEIIDEYRRQIELLRARRKGLYTR